MVRFVTIRTRVSIGEGGISPLKLKMAVEESKGVETAVEDTTTESMLEP